MKLLSFIMSFFAHHISSLSLLKKKQFEVNHKWNIVIHILIIEFEIMPQ